MNTSKIVSLVIAVLAAVLVAMAGKSCADDIKEKNKERRQKNTTQHLSYHLITDTTMPSDDTSDTEKPHLIEDPEATTEREYVTVTNLLGEVVETIPVTTPEEANMPTTTLSILDAYNAKHTTEPTETRVQYETVDPENITFEMKW